MDNNAAKRIYDLMSEMRDRQSVTEIEILTEIQDVLAESQYEKRRVLVECLPLGTNIRFDHVTFGDLARIGVMPGVPCVVYQPEAGVIAVSNATLAREAVTRMYNVDMRAGRVAPCSLFHDRSVQWVIRSTIQLPLETRGVHEVLFEIGDVAAIGLLETSVGEAA